MKLLNILIFLMSIELFSNSINNPISFNDSLYYLKPSSEIDFLITDIPNIDSLIEFENRLQESNKLVPQFYGIAFNYNIELSNNGTWDTLTNGDRIWRYHIVCPDAFTINIVLENLFLTENSHISFYSEDKKSLLGPYTNRINRKHGIFSSHLVEGESIFIELFEPKQDFGKSRFVISKIVYGYKDIIKNEKNKTQLLSSASCNVNANCPAGYNYCREKYSVARLVEPTSSGLWAFCTGSLINNVRNNYTPYFLTAFHCADIIRNLELSTSEKNNLVYWSFQFGYMKEYCNGSINSPTYEYSGSDFRSGWASTDFLLVELQEQPNPGETNFKDVFYSGWDRSGDTPSNVTALHHPVGDYMKTSKDSDEPTTWTNYWVIENWDSGTTESGSSGCPLFNENNKIIGQNLGQLPAVLDPVELPCEVNKETIFGKLSLSWNGGGTPSTRLKDWLDPDDTGVEVLDGIYTPNLRFGQHTSSGQNHHYYAYSDHVIGSSQYSSYVVESSATLTLQAGREIVIKPCTYIKEGSEFHAFIQPPDCDDIVLLSHKWSDHNPNVCSTYPKDVITDRERENLLIQSSKLTLSPNPTTGDATAKVEINKKSICSLTLFDNLGNEVITIFKNKELMRGVYEFDIETSRLSSGVYFCILRIDNTMQTQKLVFLK